MKTNKLYNLSTLSVLLFASLSAQAESTENQKMACMPVSGKIVTDLSQVNCTSRVGLCTAGTITGAGILNGNTRYTASSVGTTAADSDFVSSLSYTGVLEITPDMSKM